MGLEAYLSPLGNDKDYMTKIIWQYYKLANITQNLVWKSTVFSLILLWSIKEVGYATKEA